MEKIFSTYGPETQQALVALVGLYVAGTIGACVYFVPKLYKKLLGKIMGKKRAKMKALIADILGEEFKEVVEDRFVAMISNALTEKRITIDDARMIYAYYGHLGFWGLHPRKFQPVKTGLDLQELKEELRKKHPKANGKASNERVDAFMQELNTAFA